MLEEKKKNLLIIGLILIFLIVFIFIIRRRFLSKTEEIYPGNPETVVLNYLAFIQKDDSREAAKYLFSDLEKVIVLEKRYKNVYYSPWFATGFEPTEKNLPLPEYQVKNKEVKGEEAKITVNMKANQMEGSTFFGFYLPKEIILDVFLGKEGGEWKIQKIDSPDLLIESKLGEKVEFKEGAFLTVNEINDYIPKKSKPKEGFKFLSLETKFENNSTQTIDSGLLTNWEIIDKNNTAYYPISEPESDLDQEIIPAFELAFTFSRKVNFFFEVPEEISIEEIVFQSLYKKIIFKID